MDIGLVTVMTRLRTGRSWKRGWISEWGGDFFSSSPLGPTQPPVRWLSGAAEVCY